MKRVTLVLLVLGGLLLVFIIQQTDLERVWEVLRQVGWLGLTAIIGLHFLAFLAETTLWYFTLPSAKADPKWVYRLWKAMMVGEAFNIVTPLASLGGEPVKAALLKQHCGIAYREGTAAIVLSQTLINGALVVFLLIGLILLLTTNALPFKYRLAAASGMIVFSLGVLGFFAVQRSKLLSRFGYWLGNRRLNEQTRSVLQLVHEIEDRIIAFYSNAPRRLVLAVGASFFHWVFMAIAVYVSLWFLGRPVTLSEAWILIAVVVLVRSALFILPAGFGSQEATFVLLSGAMIGAPAVGFAVALLMRSRDIMWVTWGLMIGWKLGAFRLGDRTARRDVGPGRRG